MKKRAKKANSPAAVARTVRVSMGQGHAGEVLLATASEPVSKSRKPAMSLEKRLAQYAAGVQYKDLPGEVVKACKRLLLDTLACAFAAVGSDSATIAESTFRKAFGSGGGASIIGSVQRIATEGAALVNGVLIRDLDFNDMYFGYDPCHPSEIIPAAIACCEEVGRNGRELIESMVVGYEADLRLNDAFSWSSRGFIALSHCAFAIPLVAGKAWRMPEEQIAHAVGISGAHQLTSSAINKGDISMMKALAPAHAAMDSVFDTRLAAAGFTGATNLIEWMTANIQPTQKSVSVDLDLRHFQILKVGLKRFPVQGKLQSTVEAGVNLHPLVEGEIDEINEIIVETYPATLKTGVANPDKYRPKTRETADHSMPICLAMALLDGDVNAKQFHDDRWKAREVFALGDKVKFKVGESLVAKMPKGQGANVEIRFSSGRVLGESVEIPEGDAARPMSRGSLERKFRQFADPVVGEAGSRKIIAFVDNIEEFKDVRMFTEALRGKK